jgi:hypothetical protein
MTVNLEGEVVGSRFDPLARTCHYTIERDGQRFTADVSLDDLERLKGNKQARRNLIAGALQAAMQRVPDVPS